jgi:hypothetical protein
MSNQTFLALHTKIFDSIIVFNNSIVHDLFHHDFSFYSVYKNLILHYAIENKITYWESKTRRNNHPHIVAYHYLDSKNQIDKSY